MKNMYRSVVSRTISHDVRSYEHFWMPFTHNRAFKKNPLSFERAKGQYYYLENGKELLDGISGLWCSNAGHCNPVISDAIKAQAEKLDYASCFNMSHKLPFIFAQEIIELLPGLHFNQVF